MEALIRKFKYILLFIGIIFHNHCSSQIDENINIICSYGLEEKSTIDKIEQILENPKNVVIILDEYYLYLKNILDGTVTFWDGEDKLCESVINPLLNKENLISFKFRSSPFFPSYLLLKLDSIKLNKVYSDVFEMLPCSQKDSIDELLYNNEHIETVENIIHQHYDLSTFDSLYVNIVLFNKYQSLFNLEELIDALPKDKKYFFVYTVWYKENGVNDFVNAFSKNKKYNISMYVAKKGSSNLKRGPLQFKNRKISIEKSYFPKYIYFTRDEKVSYLAIKNFNIILVDNLKHCNY